MMHQGRAEVVIVYQIYMYNHNRIVSSINKQKIRVWRENSILLGQSTWGEFSNEMVEKY